MKLDDVVCRQPLSYFLVVIFLFFFVSSYRAFIFSYLVIYLCILFQSFHRTLAWFPRFHMSGHNHGHSGVRRIMRELKELNAEQSDMYTVQPHESNVFELHFTLRGGPGTEFHGMFCNRFVLRYACVSYFSMTLLLFSHFPLFFTPYRRTLPWKNSTSYRLSI